MRMVRLNSPTDRWIDWQTMTDRWTDRTMDVWTDRTTNNRQTERKDRRMVIRNNHE